MTPRENMNKGYLALAAECNRVVQCPYPASLKHLRDLLDQPDSDIDLSRWLDANPCRVQPLAACIVAGLRQWPYVLHIVTKFASNTSGRDAILREDANLCHHLIAQTIKSKSHRSLYIAASIALLSRPLPAAMSCPANAQLLFVQLVDEAAQHPSAATVKPVYLLLKGTGSHLLGILEDSALASLEKQLLNILRTNAGLVDQCLNLYCLSIMKIVSAVMDPAFRLTASSFNTQDILASTPSSSRWKSDAMQQFLTGSKAEKSTQLVVLHVMLATKTSSPGSLKDKVQSLVLANEIVSAIPTETRETWCRANSDTIRKLQQRLSNQDMAKALEVLTLRFMGRLCEWNSLSHFVLDKIQTTFVEPSSLQIAYSLCPHVDDSTFFSRTLARISILPLLENAVEYLLAEDAHSNVHTLDALVRAVEDAHIFAQQQESLSQLSNLPVDTAFGSKLQKLSSQFLASATPSLDYEDAGFCPVLLRRKRAILVHKICKLLLHANEMQAIPFLSVASGSSLFETLLDLFAATARQDAICSHANTYTLSKHCETAVIQSDGEDSSLHQDDQLIDWREALHVQLQARAQIEETAAVGLLSRACATLETRCNDVERPLRVETKRRQRVEDKIAELTQKCAKLNAENLACGLQNQVLEAERNKYAEDLELSQRSKDTLLEKVGELEQQLCNMRRESERRVSELAQANRFVELDCIAKLARQQEELEDLRDKVTQADMALLSNDTRLAKLEGELDVAKHSQEIVRSDLRQAASRVAELEVVIASRDEKIEDLQEKVGGISVERDGLQQEISDHIQRTDELEQDKKLQSEETAAVRIQHQEVQLLCRNLNQQLQETEQQYRLQLEDGESRLATMEEEHRQSLEDLKGELKTRSSEIIQIQKRAERLQRKCNEKDRHIAEAEAMRVNLMAAMGLPQSCRKSNLYGESQTCDLQEKPSPPTPASSEDAEDEVGQSQNFHQSFTSSAGSRSGPTPKRAKSRKSVTIASPARSRAGTSIRNTRSSVKDSASTKRQPLRNASGNRAPLKQASPMKATEVASLDDSTFDGSELFAGTQGAQMTDL